MLSWIVLLPFAGSLAAAFLPRAARNAAAWLSGTVALACALMAGSQYPDMVGGEVLRQASGLHLRMDGYAWLFTMLVSGMGLLVVLYARYYMSAEDPVPRFFSFLMAFMGSMLGVVLSGHLVQLVVFWELTSFTSFMLIAYWYHREDVRRGARTSLIVTAGGGLALLLGMLLIAHITGSYQLDDVLASGDTIRSHPLYDVTLVLVLVAVLTKSAQFPLHFWLPRAMAAPTPVSAYLHSATLVKAGVFLLGRLWTVLSGTEEWFWIVGGAGATTLLVGAVSAYTQRDLKGVLAYSTISHLGLVTLLFGMNSPVALVAAVFHMMNHATFKASLFMAAGIIEHETGTRDLDRLGGLRHGMPITTAVATVAAAAMAGVPLLNGFLSKEMFLGESLASREGGALLPILAVGASAFSVAYSLRFIQRTFFGPLNPYIKVEPHEPTRGMLLPAAVLVMACVLVGVLPERMVGPLLALASGALLGGELPHYELRVWHGWTPALFLSLIAFASGITLHLVLQWRKRRTGVTLPLPRPKAARRFDMMDALISRAAGRLAHRLFTARLQPQLVLIVTAAVVAAVLPMVMVAGPDVGRALVTTPLDPLFGVLWFIGGVCAIGTAVMAKFHRLAALIMAGVVGLATVLTFAWLSAPDLALTQVMVETVTLALILLGLRWLPRRLPYISGYRRSLRARARRVRDLLIAVACGTGMTALTWALTTREPRGELGPWFLRNALELGHGHNVVNVILVDFRGFDTLGEITVVCIVAIVVYALLRRFRPAPESLDRPRVQKDDGSPQLRSASATEDSLPAGDMRIPTVLARLLLPIAALVSIHVLLRGHHEPGGGFIGGLVMATGVLLQYMAGGTIWVESRLRVHPLIWMGLGLLCAATAGMLAWTVRESFLTAQILHLHLPLLGEIPLQSVLLFDIGVYLLVVGATLLILVALAHQSLRSPRRAHREDTAEEH